MSLRPRALLCFLSLSFVAGGSPVAARERIALQAKADEGYTQSRLVDGKVRPETYVFSPGKYFAGAARDRSISLMTFDDIVRTLAPDLAKQSYLPATDLATADLVIVVHWGTTLIDEFAKDQEALMQMSSMLASGEPVDAAELRFLQSMAITDQMSTQAYIRRNAELLGYEEDLVAEQRRIVASTREETMMHELNEERYFVILMAWDARALREKRKRLLWSTRFSMRSPGINFRQALPTMSQFAGNYYGQNLKSLQHGSTKRARPIVEIGEATVVEGDATPPTPSRPAR